MKILALSRRGSSFRLLVSKALWFGREGDGGAPDVEQLRERSCPATGTECRRVRNLVWNCRPVFADLGMILGRREHPDAHSALLEFKDARPGWIVRSRTTQFQPVIVLDQKFIPAHSQPIEDTS